MPFRGPGGSNASGEIDLSFAECNLGFAAS